jgi:DNA (cytosine-5)-methyltransferase 1
LVEVAEPLDASYGKTTDSAGSNGAGPRNVVLGSAAMSVRRLTPVECERLQGFPDGWTDELSDSGRYRCLGNAVCVPVVEWIVARIVESLA